MMSDVKVLVVTNDLSEYVKLEHILKQQGIKEIQRAKFSNDALVTMSLTVFDLVIIYANDNVASLGQNSFLSAMKEYVHYTPATLVLVNESNEHSNNSYIHNNFRGLTALPTIDFCLVFDIANPASIELFNDTVTSAIELNRMRKEKKINSKYNKNTIFPKFPGIGIAISTGGPKTIYDVFAQIPNNFVPPIFIVQHGPNWVMEDYVVKFRKYYNLNAEIVRNEQPILPNKIYIAPDKLNMVLDKQTFSIKLLDSEKECFVKPAADPLFRSIARTFGQFSIAVVMTGMGNDGSKGSLHIEAAGGTILVEDPSSAIAPSMPKSLINTVNHHTVYNSKAIGQALFEVANNILIKLQNPKTKQINKF